MGKNFKFFARKTIYLSSLNGADFALVNWEKCVSALGIFGNSQHVHESIVVRKGASSADLWQDCLGLITHPESASVCGSIWTQSAIFSKEASAFSLG